MAITVRQQYLNDLAAERGEPAPFPPPIDELVLFLEEKARGMHELNLPDRAQMYEGAAKRLESLTAGNERLRAALRHCLEHCEKEGGPDVEFIRDDNSGHMLNVEMIRAALQSTEGES